MDNTEYFVSSLSFDGHPMKNIEAKIKKDYYYILVFFVTQGAAEWDEAVKCRLNQYELFLTGRNNKRFNKEAAASMAVSIVKVRFQYFWGRKYRYWLVCDIALALLDKAAILRASETMKYYMTKYQQQQLQQQLNVLFSVSGSETEGLISQYQRNSRFLSQREHRFIVTANMSAGKSTLINALIGKPLSRASQEVCTGNVCYLYNKPFEDGQVNLETTQLKLDVSSVDLAAFQWNSKINIASYFRGMEAVDKRLCIIDTPGVNSSVNRNHGRIARKALLKETYDKVIYVFSAGKLGTDEEISHLKWMAGNIPKDKVVFVLNKLDYFRSVEDNITASMNGVHNDLTALGYESPVIYPLSAYFSLLIKMKHNGDHLTDDELDEYNLFIKKFDIPAYNLAKYYEKVYITSNDNEGLRLSKKSGLYGLEKALFGGCL